MINTKKAVDRLIEVFNVTEFVGVPCSYLKNIINEVSNRGIYRSFFNEGDAVAYAVGKQIANPGTRVCILMQNSGVGNAVNPITSLSEIYGIPLLFIIGNRQPVPDEPQHSIMGKITGEMLQMCLMDTEGIGVELSHQDDECDLPIYDSEDVLKGSFFYLINDKNVFTKVELINTESNKATLTYENVISMLDDLRNKRNKKFIQVTTTGYTSRIAYLKDSPLNFYNVGSMGCAWSVANGLVQNKEKLPVICVDGDGSYYMRRSSEKTFEGKSRCVRIILENGCYRSTGAQSLQLHSEDYDESVIETIDDLNALENLLERFIESGQDWDGSNVYIKINNDVPSELVRPKESSLELKVRLQRELNPGVDIPDPEIGVVDYSLKDSSEVEVVTNFIQ